MGMGFAPTWLRQVSPLLHMTTLTTDQERGKDETKDNVVRQHHSVDSFYISVDR